MGRDIVDPWPGSCGGIFLGGWSVIRILHAICIVTILTTRFFIELSHESIPVLGRLDDPRGTVLAPALGRKFRGVKLDSHVHRIDRRPEFVLVIRRLIDFRVGFGRFIRSERTIGF
jgi:hypothetical protein